MLTHVLHYRRTEDWVAAWLQHELPRDYEDAQVEEGGVLRFSFSGRHEDVAWDVGRCVKLLQRAEPEQVVYLLYSLCCLYDFRQETSETLQRAVLKELGCTGAPAFFRWSDENEAVLTTMVLKGRRGASDVVLVGTSSHEETGAFPVMLPCSEWLRDVLLQHLVQRL